MVGAEIKSRISSSGPLGHDDTGVSALPLINNSLLISLLRAREKVISPIRDMLNRLGITEQQWRVLRVLHETGPLDATGLAENAVLHLASQTRIVQTLIDKGLVTRAVDPGDRRRQTLEISRTGADLIRNNQDAAAQITRNIEDRLGSEKLGKLLDLLDELNRA